MKKIKNILIYLITCFIIIASFKMPEILMKMENDNIENKVYEQSKIKNSIDVEAENIYLVKAIHSIEDEKNRVAIMTSDKNSKYVEVEEATETNIIIKSSLEKEIAKLKEYDILENLEIKKEEKLLTKITNVAYQNDNNKYVLENIYVRIEDREYLFIIEEKTGKILCIGVENGEISNIELEQLMRNYIKYLDLYIIDDWKFEDNKLKSKKAELEVYFIEDRNNCALTIHSTDRIYAE